MAVAEGGEDDEHHFFFFLINKNLINVVYWVASVTLTQ